MTTQTIIGNLNQLSANARVSKPMSDKYKTYDTKTLVENIVRDLGLDCTIKAKGNIPGRVSTSHFVEIGLKETFTLPDGLYSPRVIIRNSYAGEGSLSVQCGIFRYICENGLTIGSKTFAIRIRHVGRTQEQVYAELRANILVAIENAKKLAQTMYAGMSENISVVDLKRKINTLDLSKKVQDVVLYRFKHATRPEDATQTLWAAYNIINEVMRERSRSEMRTLDRNNNLSEKLIAA